MCPVRFLVVQTLAQDVFPNTVAVQIVDQRAFAEAERGIQRTGTGVKVADADEDLTRTHLARNALKGLQQAVTDTLSAPLLF